jgi:hypothetical protein
MSSKSVSLEHKDPFTQHDPLQCPPPKKAAHDTNPPGQIHTLPWATPSHHANANVNQLCDGGRLKSIILLENRISTNFKHIQKLILKSVTKFENPKTQKWDIIQIYRQKSVQMVIIPGQKQIMDSSLKRITDRHRIRRPSTLRTEFGPVHDYKDHFKIATGHHRMEFCFPPHPSQPITTRECAHKNISYTPHKTSKPRTGQKWALILASKPFVIPKTTFSAP